MSTSVIMTKIFALTSDSVVLYFFRRNEHSSCVSLPMMTARMHVREKFVEKEVRKRASYCLGSKSVSSTTSNSIVITMAAYNIEAFTKRFILFESRQRFCLV